MDWTYDQTKRLLDGTVSQTVDPLYRVGDKIALELTMGYDAKYVAQAVSGRYFQLDKTRKKR